LCNGFAYQDKMTPDWNREVEMNFGKREFGKGEGGYLDALKGWGGRREARFGNEV